MPFVLLSNPLTPLPPYTHTHTHTHTLDSKGNPRCITNSKGRKHRPGTRDLAVAVKTNDTLFLDFLRRCLEWDPSDRMTPEDALRHEWILEVRGNPLAETFWQLSSDILHVLPSVFPSLLLPFISPFLFTPPLFLLFSFSSLLTPLLFLLPLTFFLSLPPLSTPLRVTTVVPVPSHGQSTSPPPLQGVYTAHTLTSMATQRTVAPRILELTCTTPRSGYNQLGQTQSLKLVKRLDLMAM